MTTSLLTLSQVALRLHVSEDAVRGYVREGWLPAMRVGKLLRFDSDAVEAALRQRVIEPEGASDD